MLAISFRLMDLARTSEYHEVLNRPSGTFLGFKKSCAYGVIVEMMWLAIFERIHGLCNPVAGKCRRQRSRKVNVGCLYVTPNKYALSGGDENALHEFTSPCS